MTYKTLTKKILADSFGSTEEALTPACLEIFESMKKRYRVVDGIDREKLIVNVLKRIEDDKQVIGAPERTDKWDKGWKENYRTWLFEKTFSHYDSIYDIGCGSSYNLIKLCNMFPDKKIYGFDFVQSSVDIVSDLVEKHSLNAQGGLFNMIDPDFNIELDSNSLVFTSGAIEQIASKFEKFLEFLLEKKPQIVVHVEPTYEVYDQDILFDYLAAKFHSKRGYTMGYLPRLKQLELDGKIEILNVKRLNFGSLFFEGFTNIIWKPV